MDPKLAEVVAYLSRAKVRATYGAVAGLLGVIPQSMGARLGPRNRAASWIVNASTGMPSGYPPEDIDPALAASGEIIRDAAELRRRLEGAGGRGAG